MLTCGSNFSEFVPIHSKPIAAESQIVLHVLDLRDVSMSLIFIYSG